MWRTIFSLLKYRFCPINSCVWGHNQSRKISTKRCCFVIVKTIHDTKTKIVYKLSHSFGLFQFYTPKWIWPEYAHELSVRSVMQKSEPLFTLDVILYWMKIRRKSETKWVPPRQKLEKYNSRQQLKYNLSQNLAYPELTGENFWNGLWFLAEGTLISAPTVPHWWRGAGEGAGGE